MNSEAVASTAISKTVDTASLTTIANNAISEQDGTQLMEIVTYVLLDVPNVNQILKPASNAPT
jgi:hypothetical protein